MKHRIFITLTLVVALSACTEPDSTVDGLEAPALSLVTVDNDSCIFDSRTGLLWQGKTDVPGLHDFRNTYSWYSPDEATGELDYRGVANGGTCADSQCDTWHYREAVNKAGYCGHEDWRLPGKGELLSISDLRRAEHPPTINTDFFRYTQAAEYWSGNDYSFQWDAAWAWNFQYGHDRVDWKKVPKFVRLVRGSAANLPEVKE